MYVLFPSAVLARVRRPVGYKRTLKTSSGTPRIAARVKFGFRVVMLEAARPGRASVVIVRVEKLGEVLFVLFVVPGVVVGVRGAE